MSLLSLWSKDHKDVNTPRITTTRHEPCKSQYCGCMTTVVQELALPNRDPSITEELKKEPLFSVVVEIPLESVVQAKRSAFRACSPGGLGGSIP